MCEKLFLLLLCMPFALLSQISITGKVIDQNTNTPLPFAIVKETNKSYALASAAGEFVIRCKSYPIHLTINHLGYLTKTFSIQSKDIVKVEIRLTPTEENLDPVKLDITGNAASAIIKEAINQKNKNNPQKALNNYTYKSYNKFKITEDNLARFESPDTSKVALEKIFNDSHSFLSEKISQLDFKKGNELKETILATRMSGFNKPVYNVLGIKIQSNSLYKEHYTIFNTKYAAPLSNKSLKNYYYKILDTTKGKRPAYVILFQPRRSKKIASLEGVLYLDTKTLAIQKAIAELRGELNIIATHNFKYDTTHKIWLPSFQEIHIRPGTGKQKVTLFGGQISVGRLTNNKKKYTGNNDFLVSKTDFFDFKTTEESNIKTQQATIEIAPEASIRNEEYWNSYRTTTITSKDLKSFTIIDSIVKAQNIERRINIIQNFNIGYYPMKYFNFDLTYPIKYNNYEGFRLGIGGLTNNTFSKRFRIEGYTAYGFKDQKIKFGIGSGILLHKNSGSWLNINYSDDLKEVGSFSYLTDRRVYSLFEPRLVNIDFYYKHRTWSTSLQHRILPKLLSEAQISISNINQTRGYTYKTDGNTFTEYKTAESTIALRWNPYSKFLKTPNGYKEIQEGYPKISAQYTQGFKGFLGSHFNYNKIGIKVAYKINSINQSSTSFLLEGNIASGDVPLTHLYHAYPNAPTKQTILQRFSVAGRRGFETMFFSEFFSDRLATLQISHRIKPFKITNWLKPELVLISRYAIGDISNQKKHIGVNFNSLQEGYQESGFEINKLFAGFGISFAYRYGAYHLPRLEDNIAFKFTFYLKL